MEVREITEDRFIECLAIDFPNFKVTKSNLTHPTSQFVISFYALILRHVIELNEPEEIWNLTEDQRSYMNSYHPEAATFGQHVWANNLHAAVKYVFSQLSKNGTEFVYSDILFPENTPRRSFVFMAMMLHFYWYTNDFAVDLNNDMVACLEEVRQIQNSKSERDKLISQLKEIEDRRFQYVESFKETKKVLKKCSDANEEQETIMKELLAKEELVQEDLEKVEEEEQKLQETYTKLQNEKKYLESLIVSNQNQVIDIHQKQLSKKDECVKKMKILEEQVKTASTKLQQSHKVLELQQKLNFYLKNENFLPEASGKHRAFQNLFENIKILSEKKKIVAEEESTLMSKVAEVEETIPRLKDEYAEYELKQEEILLQGKEKTKMFANIIDNLKKNHSQLFLKMRKDEEELEEFSSTCMQLNTQCDEMEEKIESFDTDNKNRYLSYEKEMKTALNLIQSIFPEERENF